MKKYFTIALALLTFFMGISKVNASNLSLGGSISTTSTTVGNSITVKFTYSSSEPLGAVVYSMTYDTSKLTLTSGTQSGAPVYTGSEKSATISYTFKAKASGSASITFKINEAVDFAGNNMTTPSTTKTVNIKTQAQVQASYSSNNNLSSLTVSSGTLSPAFNKNTTAYEVTVENDITSITVGGTREDNKSSVDGFKEHVLEEGINKIVVKVTAQNGSSKDYVINVTRKELAPIEVETTDNKKLFIVRKKELINKPSEHFEESTLKLDEEVEVPSLVYKVNDQTITLVGLKDNDGNISLYRYDDKKYSPYLELVGEKIILINVTNIKDIPDGYKETKLKINDIEYIAYQKNSSTHYLVYGTNLDNGKNNIYVYETSEKTLQLYDNSADKQISNNDKRILKRNYVIYALAAFMIVTYIGILISMVSRLGKKNKTKAKEIEIDNRRKQDEEKLIQKEKELKELEDELKIKEENIKKELNNIKKSDKIEENINNEKKGRKKKES
jgi:hypothetical protein